MVGFDAMTRRALTQELEEAAKVIAAKYGMTAIYKTGSYTEADFSTTIKFEIPGAAKEKNEMYAPILGLPADIIGKTFRHKTKIFTVKSLNLSKPKNAVTIEDQNGKGFVCSPDQLKRFMNI